MKVIIITLLFTFYLGERIKPSINRLKFSWRLWQLRGEKQMIWLRNSKQPETGGKKSKKNFTKLRKITRLPRRLVVSYLVIAAVLVFGTQWIYRSLSDNAPENPAPTQQNGSQDTQKKPQSSSQKPKSSPQPANGELPNSGPGDVLSLFVGTSLVAASLHYIVQLRRGQRA